MQICRGLLSRRGRVRPRGQPGGFEVGRYISFLVFFKYIFYFYFSLHSFFCFSFFSSFIHSFPGCGMSLEATVNISTVHVHVRFEVMTKMEIFVISIMNNSTPSQGIHLSASADKHL